MLFLLLISLLLRVPSQEPRRVEGMIFFLLYNTIFPEHNPIPNTERFSFFFLSLFFFFGGER